MNQITQQTTCTNNLVSKRNNQVITTSLAVAEVFGKEHKNITRDIKNLIAQNGAVEKMFAESVYRNERNREYPMYYMNRDGFSLLAMGFTGKKAVEFKLKFIEQFNLMEKQLKTMVPRSYDDAIIALAGEITKRKEIEKKSKAAISYIKHYSGSEGSMTVTQIAKSYGLSANSLNRILEKARVQYKVNKQWVLYQKYANKGYTTTKSHIIDITDEQDKVVLSTRWTPAGQTFIHNVLIEEGYVELDVVF